MSRIALLLLIATSASAQTGPRFDHLGPDQGLPSRDTYAVAQDSSGLIWISTVDGLARWDGYRMRTFFHDSDVPGSLPDDHVTPLAVAPDGTLWLGTRLGAATFDVRTESFVPVPADEACAGGVTRIAFDSQGDAWAVVADRVCRVIDGQLTYVVIGGKAERIAVLSMTTPADGGLAVFSRNDDVAQVCWTDADLCEALAPAAKGAYMGIAFEGDVYAWPIGEMGEERSLLRLRPGVPAEPIGLVLVLSRALVGGGDATTSSDGTFWVPTLDGIDVLSIEARTVSTLRADPADQASLGGRSVRGVLRDRAGTRWAAHDNGVSVWHRQRYPFGYATAAQTPGSLSDQRVNGMVVARDGALWVATNDGLNRRPRGSEAFEAVRPTLPSMRADRSFGAAFWSVFQEADGRMWIGAKRWGLLEAIPDGPSYRLEPQPGLVARVGEVRQSNQSYVAWGGVRHVTQDSRGRLWMSGGDVLAVRDRGEWTAFYVPPGGPLAWANVVHEDVRGRLWLGGDDGLRRIRETPDGPRADDDAITPGRMWSIAQTPADSSALYLGTVGDGLMRFVPGTGVTRRWDRSDGLDESTAFGVVADEAGTLWFSTPRGLGMLAPHSDVPRLFTGADGLGTSAFDLMSYARDAQTGRLYFGGPDGLVDFDPRVVSSPTADVQPVVSGVRVGDLDVPYGSDTLRLARDHAAVEVRFASLDYANPPAMRYRYRLSGVDSDWRIATGPDPVAQYAALPPGTHRLDVFTSDGPDARGAMLVVVVPRAWYEQAWAWMLGIALFGGLMAAAWQAVDRRRRSEEEHRQAEASELRARLTAARERERVRLARDLHDGPVQGLYRLGHQLDELEETLSLGQTEAVASARKGVPQARASVGALATELRGVLTHLRPTIVEHLGLTRAIDAELRRLSARYPDTSFAAGWQADASALSTAVQLALYRIAQEALQNVVRHAAARRVDVSLMRENRTLVLTVRDDGQGFVSPPSLLDLARDEHFGLAGAAERAQEVGAAFRLHSAPGQGTTVTVRVGPTAKIDK